MFKKLLKQTISHFRLIYLNLYYRIIYIGIELGVQSNAAYKYDQRFN